MSKEGFQQQQKPALGPLTGGNSHMLSGATAVGSALLYGGTAVAMNFVNKLTLQTFPMPNIILLLQMLAMLGILLVCNMLGLTSVSLASWEKARSMILITLLYTANTSTALMGLTTLSIPMYSTLKRLTPMIVIIVKSAINRRLPEWSITSSVGLVVMGCVVASVGDLKFDSYGYLMALLSCTLQASYLLLVEASGAEKGHGTAELLYYNALLSVPFMLLVVVVSGEAEKLAAASSLAAASMGGAVQWGLLLLVCSCCGCLLNYSLFLCTIHNNALTTTVIGVLKGVVATLLGFVLLGGVEFHSVNVAGICCNTLGGIWYTTIRYRQRMRAKQASVPAAGSLAAGKGSSVIQLQARAGGSLV